MTLFLLLLLILVFSSLNLIMFYLFFERRLIPTIILIFGWGYQPERIRAGIYLLFYTLFGSYPFFVRILYLYYLYNSLFFGLLNLFKLNFRVLFCLSIMVAFFMKIPIYLLHL
jgi:NADH-ubiquinone oxidoreductase chain 4